MCSSDLTPHFTEKHRCIIAYAAEPPRITKPLRRNMCRNLADRQHGKGVKGMAFNILDIMNAATKAEAGQNRDYQDIVVNYRDIVVTKHNKYSMDELQEIATGIEMDGLQQPLVLGRVNGKYWLVSGHRRLGGIKILVAEGKAGFENVKCRYKDMTEIEFRIALLVGNTFNRKMTDYDLMT